MNKKAERDDSSDRELIDSVVKKGWNRAQGIGYTYGEILDAYRYETQIKAALEIGAEEMLKQSRNK